MGSDTLLQCSSGTVRQVYKGGDIPGTWAIDLRTGTSNMQVDITIGGRAVKAVAQPTKQGVLYTFNRETGAPIWPIEERPVPKGDAPGEWYSPTQPFPLKPPPIKG